jgi:Kef-type K+ transport system membrane component KefB
MNLLRFIGFLLSGLWQRSHLEEIQEVTLAIIFIAIGVACQAIQGGNTRYWVCMTIAALTISTLTVFIIHFGYIMTTPAETCENRKIIGINMALRTIVPLIAMLTTVDRERLPIVIKG